MDDYLYFEGQIRPMEWGDSIFTVLPIPKDITDTLSASGARRVDIELNDHPFNMALTKAPVIDDVFVYTGKSVLKAAGISPGDIIDVRLRKADSNQVDVPEDVMLAIRAADASDLWAGLTPGKMRGLLHQVTSAKRPETRAKRIQKLILDLRSAG
ncbi:MAG: YdeI/OmpD-associated family protein [Pseudomonadota bacterium]